MKLLKKELERDVIKSTAKRLVESGTVIETAEQVKQRTQEKWAEAVSLLTNEVRIKSVRQVFKDLNMSYRRTRLVAPQSNT